MDRLLTPDRNKTAVMPAPVELKYFFTARFRDGSSYHQNMMDVSTIDPKRSCFYDVLQREDELMWFSLDNGENYYKVDITDGHFEVNGTPFRMHDTAIPLINMRLIFYRQREVTMTGDRWDSMVQQSENGIVYCIGWQANDEKGNNIKRIMEIE